ncbi:hypothetical protein BJ170DRAFT_691121 [Xylariales sp. AK1849]|nr:hypothetical protein BJ170DRAFT_691121 [Xylariales sp. AK1849]
MLSRFALIAVLNSLSIGVLSIDPYSSANFIRRTSHAVGIVDKTLYIDGGEIAQHIDGKIDTTQASRQVNDTLSIPLDVSWTNATVSITSISKSAPPFDSEALWTDNTEHSMYSWGGQGPYGNLSKTRDLWKFEADGSGGEWKKQPAANVDVFMSIVRTTNAAWTTCNGMGFYLGGFGSVWTDSAFAPGSLSTPVPGMLTYNLTSGVWANESMAGLNTFETLMTGTASCLPSFGTSGQGMMLTLGGEISRRDEYNSSEPNLVGLSNLTFWDINTKTWYSQQTTGDIPTPRSRFCVAGVAGRDGTYEFFVFGGYDASSQTSFDDIYVLSIPGFVWFKADITTKGPRTGQQCIVTGNRQMIIVGGANPNLAFLDMFRDVDPWINGIGVIDVTELSWSGSFDANAAAYESPDVVKTWYNAGNQEKVSWTSDTVKDLFVAKDSAGGASQGDASQSTSSSPSAPAGAIAGGVIGAVAILAVIGLIFFYRRRKKQKSLQVIPQPIQGPADDLGYPTTSPPLYDYQTEKPQEMPHDREAVLLPTEERPSELDGGQWPRQQQDWPQQQIGNQNPHEME